MADSLASRGDTAGAIEALRRAIRLNPNLAVAHFRRGVLLARTSSGAITDLFRRRAAHGELERALELDKDNPGYLLELGRLRLKTPFFRLDAGRLFRRALAAARARGDAAALADVEAELGDIYLRRSDITAHRRIISRGAPVLDPQRALEDPRFIERFLASNTVPIPDAGDADRREAEEHYRAALIAAPSHDAAARGLLAILYDGDRFEEFAAVALTYAQAAPASSRAQLALGLGLARTGRLSDAAAAFDSALALLDPYTRTAIAGLTPILRPSEVRRYDAMTQEQRSEFELLFWKAADPLRLTAVNEHEVEHLARVAYADIRYTAPELGLRGWETDRGVIYIRYGPPPVIATFAATTEVEPDDPAQIGRITTLWWYPERQLRFIFYGTPGYNSANFASDFRAFAEEARFAAPARYDNVPLSHGLDSIPVQAARFRNPGGATEAVFYAAIPIARLLAGVQLLRSSLETGLFIVDEQARTVVTRRQQEATAVQGERQFEARTFEAVLAPGGYHYQVEAQELGGSRAARGAAQLEVEPTIAGALALSDVVLADRIAPRTDAPSDRHDFLIDPNPAMAFAAGQPVNLLWEVYGLAPDSAGAAAYTVSLTIELQSIERRGLVARLLGGAADAMGVTGEGEAQVVLSYRRDLDVRGRDRVVEYLAVDLGTSPPGRYRMTVTVEDRVAGRRAARRREFTVTPPPGP